MKLVCKFSVTEIRPLNPEEGDSLMGRALLRNASYTSVASELEINLHRKDNNPEGPWMFNGVDGAIEIHLGQMFDLSVGKDLA